MQRTSQDIRLGIGVAIDARAFVLWVAPRRTPPEYVVLAVGLSDTCLPACLHIGNNSITAGIISPTISCRLERLVMCNAWKGLWCGAGIPHASTDRGYTLHPHPNPYAARSPHASTDRGYTPEPDPYPNDEGSPRASTDRGYTHRAHSVVQGGQGLLS